MGNGHEAQRAGLGRHSHPQRGRDGTKSCRILQAFQGVWNTQCFLKEGEEVGKEEREGTVFLAEGTE